MNTYRKIATVVGVLFITATLTSSLSLIFSGPVLGTSDFLQNISSHETQMIISALLMLIDAIAVVGIAITLYPILKKGNEILSIGYVGARIMEGVLFILYVIILLTILTLGQEYVKAGAPGDSTYRTLGSMLITTSDWTFSIRYGIVFTLSAMILNYILFESKLVPRWISVWGMIGAILPFVFSIPVFFNISMIDILNLPIAVQEMVFAVWLIVKGFDSSVMVSYETV